MSEKLQSKTLNVGKVAKRESSSLTPSSKNSLTCNFTKVTMPPNNKLQLFRHFLHQGSYRSLRRSPQCRTSSLKLLSRPNILTHVTETPVRQHPMGLHRCSNDPHRHLTDLSVGKVAVQNSKCRKSCKT